jgi:hypothetical protein
MENAAPGGCCAFLMNDPAQESASQRPAEVGINHEIPARAAGTGLVLAARPQ